MNKLVVGLGEQTVPPPLTIVVAVALHNSQGKRHKSVAAQEQVYYSVDSRGPPTRRTVTMPPILIESIEAAECIKGCNFSLMLFVATPPHHCLGSCLTQLPRKATQVSSLSRAGLLQC